MRWILAVSLSIALFVGCAGDARKPSDEGPSSTVTFVGTDARLSVEVADDDDEHRRGLSGIEQLPPDQGMAFLWPEPVGSRFWMKDTLIPLSIAFVDDAGRVIDVLDMLPCESDPCPTYGVDERYVLAIEANLGWFEDHGVQAGDRAELRESPDG